MTLGSPLASLCLRLAPAAALALVALPGASARAASWGSFDITRMAYDAGSLNGTVHAQFRTVIENAGDEVALPTGELTAEYLAGVDVFYTAMLSDGTGPTAGSPGTLSLDEQAALTSWLMQGGTLVVTPDSNGFDGPFPLVYDSWLDAFGVTDFVFVFDMGSGSPIVVHPITEGVADYALDGTVTFSVPPEGEVLGTAIDGVTPLIVVLEPASGFEMGGRIVVIADHNLLTDNYIGELDNLVLAQNLVEWAQGECGNGVVEGNEECDDGNLEDGDGCDSTCVADGGTTSGGDTTGSVDESGTGSGGGTATPGEDTDIIDDPVTGASDDGTPGEMGGGDEGCSCRSTGDTSSPAALALLLLALGVRRRRRAG